MSEGRSASIGLVMFGALFLFRCGDAGWQSTAEQGMVVGELEQKLVSNEFGIPASERERILDYLQERVDPSVVLKSIVTSNGDVLDCIPIEEQRSVKLLQAKGVRLDLSIRAPRFPLDGEALDSGISGEEPPAGADPILAGTSSDGNSCDQGSVPVRRISFEEIATYGSLEAYYRKPILPALPASSAAGGPAVETAEPHEYVTGALAGSPSYGIRAYLNVWSPSVADNPGHFSLSQLWASHDNADLEIETVEAGLITRKNAAGRLFVFFTNNDYENLGTDSCWNNDCGFVQVASGTYLDNVFDSYSAPGGTQIEARIELFKDEWDGHWWFRFNGTWVGYWPVSLFYPSGIGYNARFLSHGGEVSYPDSLPLHTATDMGGDGTFGSNSGRYEHAAYQRELQRVDKNFSVSPPTLYYTAAGTTLSESRVNCYDGYKTTYASPWFETLFFGGTGYHTSGPSSNYCTTPTEP